MNMPIKQQIFSLLICLLVFVFTINMVRKRRLREEYSVLWLGTSLLMFVLVVKYNLLVAITGFIGAVLPTTTLFLCANIFLFLIAMQFSFRISKHADQIKNLVQENTLLRGELERLKQQR
jgi:hypothetical protein